METKFQTSFIPKKPMISSGLTVARTPKKGVSLFMIFGVLIFLLSLGAVGATYAWKQYLVNQQDSYKQQLADRQKQFNTDLIEQLKQVNVQIDLATQLLNNHLALSQVFDIIGHFTTASSRFTSLDVSAPTNQSSGVTINMNGYGKNFETVAFQSDVLGQLQQYGLRKLVKNPILSNPSLAADGSVSFGFTATLDAPTLSYKQSVTSGGALSAQNNQSSLTGQATTTGN